MTRTITAVHLTAYREHLQQEEKSAATVEKYLRDAGAFASFSKGKAVTKELTITYKQSLVERNYKVRSVNSMLAGLNSFLSFLGWTDCKVKILRCQKKAYCTQAQELTKAEYMRLLEASRKQVRLNLILQTICATGIRISELNYFTVEAVHSGEVNVRCKNKTRSVLIPSKLKRLLLHYARQKGIRKGAIFLSRNGNPLDRSNIWAQMKKLCAAAAVNPAKVFPHNLRKLFARTFYAMEKDIAKLADVLGHGSIETTRIYIMTTGTEHRRQMERMGLLL